MAAQNNAPAKDGKYYQELISQYNKGIGQNAIAYNSAGGYRPLISPPDNQYDYPEAVIGSNDFGEIKVKPGPFGKIYKIIPGPNNIATFEEFNQNGQLSSRQVDMTPDKNRALTSLFKAAAVAAPMYVGPALASAGLISAPGAAAAAQATTAATTAASTAPEIGSGLFSSGLEAAAYGAPPSLTGSTLLGGASEAAPLTMSGIEAGSFAAPVIGGAVKPPANTGDLMDWLGSPAAQLAGQAINAGVQYSAADRASEQQQQAAQAAMEEQRRQFDITRQSLAPFAQAGTQALGGFAPYQAAGLQAFGQQQALAGLQGQQAQRQAIGALEASPEYQALARQGEEAILQRASATGGLRGGNVQAALAQFRPAMLQQLIDQQYQRLGGFAGTGLQTTTNLAEMGRAAATQQGSFGSATAANIGNLLTQQGQAQAGGTLGRARGISEFLSAPAQIYGFQRGLGQA